MNRPHPRDTSQYNFIVSLGQSIISLILIGLFSSFLYMAVEAFQDAQNQASREISIDTYVVGWKFDINSGLSPRVNEYLLLNYTYNSTIHQSECNVRYVSFSRSADSKWFNETRVDFMRLYPFNSTYSMYLDVNDPSRVYKSPTSLTWDIIGVIAALLALLFILIFTIDHFRLYFCKIGRNRYGEWRDPTDIARIVHDPVARKIKEIKEYKEHPEHMDMIKQKLEHSLQDQPLFSQYLIGIIHQYLIPSNEEIEIAYRALTKMTRSEKIYDRAKYSKFMDIV